jgi:hypothetical protein
MKGCTDDPMVPIRRAHDEIDDPSDVGSFLGFAFLFIDAERQADESAQSWRTKESSRK